MIKLQAPENCTSANYKGEIYTVNKKGIITVPLEAASDLIKFHKFTNIIETLVENKINIINENIKKADTVKKIENEVKVEAKKDTEVKETNEF